MSLLDNLGFLNHVFSMISAQKVMEVLQEKCDAILTSTPRNPSKVSLGLVTRLRAKKFKKVINGSFQDTRATRTLRVY